MGQQTNEIYEFSPFRLDRQERLLWQEGATISLTPKAFDLLLALLERSGRLVEKEELFKTVWPDAFVEESNLSSNIALIRKALGDDASAPRFVETVPKRGYRFIADLHLVEAQLVSRAGSAAPLAIPSPALPELPTIEKHTEKEPDSFPAGLLHQNRRLLIALGILAVLVIIAVAARPYFSHKPVLTEKDTILLADFENRTGDTIFDGTLKQGLAIQLQQSQFLGNGVRRRTSPIVRLN